MSYNYNIHTCAYVFEVLILLKMKLSSDFQSFHLRKLKLVACDRLQNVCILNVNVNDYTFECA